MAERIGPSRNASSPVWAINLATYASNRFLIPKLPSALRKMCAGATFDAGKGAPMKEWLTVLPEDSATWSALAQEALAFVARHRPSS